MHAEFTIVTLREDRRELRFELDKQMNTTTEILVLLGFLALAAVGVAGGSKSSRTSSDWMSAAGLLGAVGWVCWIFLRPGGDSFYQFWAAIRDFLRPN